MSELVIERLSGAAIAPYLPALAALRIEVFRAYPYLYEGSLAYEQRYLRLYAQDARSVVVLARRGQEVVGASSALPLRAHDEALARLLAAAGYAPERVYYFGESVLKESERGRGIGHRFFDEREATGREHGFTWAAFCAVERASDHPLRPASYRSLDRFWQQRGYRRRPELVTTFTWRDAGETGESEKKMVFWLKELES